MNDETNIEGIQAIHDLLTSQVKLVWNKIARKYKIQRNIRIKLIATSEAGLNKGFRCGDCGPVIIKAPLGGQVMAILRVPLSALPTGLDGLMDSTIPHGLTHIACQLRPDLGHGYQHDAGFNEVYNWAKESA